MLTYLNNLNNTPETLQASLVVCRVLRRASRASWCSFYHRAEQ
jgi:hypothetical protein